MAQIPSRDGFGNAIGVRARNTPEEVMSAIKYIKTHRPSDEAQEIMVILGINEKEQENG